MIFMITFLFLSMMTTCSAVAMTDYERRQSSRHTHIDKNLGSSVYDVDVVKAWLVKGRADPELASTILDTGGFACWATLTQLGLEHLRTNFMFASERVRVLDLCYPMMNVPSKDGSGNRGHEHRKNLVKHHSKNNTTEADTNSSGVICNRQHNGFGNQMFQYVFSRLAADSLGREWTTAEIVPGNNETPFDRRDRPPNTDVGWGVFNTLFANAAVHESPYGRNKNATFERARVICKDDFRSDGVCRMSDRPYDMRLYKQNMFEQMLDAFWRRNQCTSGCVYLAGYFQEVLYFWPERKKILSWFSLPDALDAFAHAADDAVSQGTNTTRIDNTYPDDILRTGALASTDAAATAATATATAAHAKPRFPNLTLEELAAEDAPSSPPSRSLKKFRQLTLASGPGPDRATLIGTGVASKETSSNVRTETNFSTLHNNHSPFSVTFRNGNVNVSIQSLISQHVVPAQPQEPESSSQDVLSQLVKKKEQGNSQMKKTLQLRQRQRRQLSVGEMSAADATTVAKPVRDAAATPLPPLLASPEGYPSMDQEDMAVHVRCCEPAGMCNWLFMPWGYYEQVLSWNAKEHSTGKVWLITTPQCTNSKLISSILLVYPQAELVHAPEKNGAESKVANNFRFLMNSPRLLLGKSTFGFWAGYLSPVVQEVHMPIDPRAFKRGYSSSEKIPFAYDDPRYVHHAWEDGKWFGRPDKVTGEVVYELQGPMISLKQMVPN